MTPGSSERGAALLTVLMLVAVIATIAATALDRLTIATRLAANSGIVAQGRQWMGFAEQLAAVRLEDLAAASPTRTVAGPWLGRVRRISLPDGSVIEAEVRDGGNCFNLNSLVKADFIGAFAADPQAMAQMSALLLLLGVDQGRADAIAAAAADWIDSDDIAQPGGGETGSYGSAQWRPANALMADPRELGAVRGMTPELLSVLQPFVCALPDTAPSGINPNTLLPEQAVLIAMLAPGKMSLAQARAQIAGRPVDGFASSVTFWQSPVLAGVTLAPGSAEQIRMKTRWFELRTRIEADNQSQSGVTLIDLNDEGARVVRRRYGDTA